MLITLTCPSVFGLRRDLLVRSVLQRWIIDSPSSGTTSVPLHLGETCLSGPPFNVGSSIAFHRGLKSRVESGAKAPHSMECGDSSPLFCEGFSLHNLAVDPDGTELTGRGGTGPCNPCNRKKRSTASIRDLSRSFSSEGPARQVHCGSPCVARCLSGPGFNVG